LILLYFTDFRRVDVDRYVTHPRHFGEMAEWLKTKSVLLGKSQEDRELYMKTLIRWPMHFFPGRYPLNEPNYSELFGHARA
jgi:hypothetical protein